MIVTKNIIRYLKSIIKYKICYCHTNQGLLKSYIDEDYVKNLDTGRSIFKNFYK